MGSSARSSPAAGLTADARPGRLGGAAVRSCMFAAMLSVTGWGFAQADAVSSSASRDEQKPGMSVRPQPTPYPDQNVKASGAAVETPVADTAHGPIPRIWLWLGFGG